VLVNAEPTEQVPGRQTDVKDYRWIAELFAHRQPWLRFIPRPIRHLKATVNDRTQKMPEDGDVKFAYVGSDMRGVSARGMPQATVATRQTPTALADLARQRLCGKLSQLRGVVR